LDKLFNHVTILKRNKGFYCVIAKNNWLFDEGMILY
jgi:hypothetical protein